jgi:uncharacterized protein YkwD
VLLVLVATVIGAAGSPASAGSSHAAALQPRSDRYESRLQAVINDRRAAHGLRPLRVDRCTDRIAERWGRHLARDGAFEHQSLSPLLRRCEAQWAGETLAYGRVTPVRMVRMWMHSPGHRAILLSRQANRVGIGAARDSRGWVVAADFTRL